MKTSMLLVLPWSPDEPGGVSIVVRNLERQWALRGLPTALMVSDWRAARLAVDPAGTATLRLAVVDTQSAATILGSLFTAPLTLFRTWRFLRERRISSVSFHYASLDALGIALLKRLGLYRGRLVLCFHGTDVRRPASRLQARIWDTLFASADGVTACSKALARLVHQSYGLAQDRVTVVYNGVDNRMFTPQARARPGPAPDLACDSYIVSIGGFIERKGHRFLLDAFAQLAEKYAGLCLVIIGQDGAERRALETQAGALGLTQRIRFLLNLRPEDVAAAVARAAVCIQPSLAEPFGLAVIEAGACGVCVAVSSVGGHLELIEDGQTGLLFPPADASALAGVLDRLLADVPARQAMAARFREQILARYTWERCADAYLAISECTESKALEGCRGI